MKTKHVQQIEDFFLNNNKEIFRESKLIALYRLIQIKGVLVKPEENKKPFKAIKLNSNYYGLIHKKFPKSNGGNYKTENFFPCRIDLVIMQMA